MAGTVNRDRTRFGHFLREVGDELAADRDRRVPSSPPAEIEWRRLDKGITPVPGESLRGLVVRACERNTLPNSWGVLQHLGLTHRNRVLVSEDPNVNLAELAYALNVAEEEVRTRRYEPTGSGRVSFYGLELNPRRIETHVRRFSPATLRDPEKRFHHAAWELKDIPFCLEGWDMLQDKCFCEGDGIVQGWTRTLTKVWECDRCGDPLHWLEPHYVPMEMRPALSILSALLDPRPNARSAAIGGLPIGLRGTDRSRLHGLVVRMARAVDPDADGHSIDEPETRLAGLHNACEAISRWPAGLDRIGWHESTPASAIDHIHRQWAEFGAGTRAKPKAAVSPPFVGIRPAYEMAGLSSDVLRAAWDHKLVTQHTRKHGSRWLPAFDVAELPTFASAWRDRIEPEALSYRLGIPYYGLEQLAALGVLKSDAPALPDTGPHFRPRTVSAFLVQLEGNANAELDDTSPLKTMMESIGGRAKPWGPVLELLHRPGIDFTLVDGANLMDRIRIPTREVDSLTALAFDRAAHPGFRFRERLVRRDALELLNVHMNGERLLADLQSSGTNPETFAVRDVEERAKLIMSVPELAARLGLQYTSAYHRARRSGAREIIPGGWDRVALTGLR